MMSTGRWHAGGAAVVACVLVAGCEPEFHDIYCSDPIEAGRPECVGRVPGKAAGGSGAGGAAGAAEGVAGVSGGGLGGAAAAAGGSQGGAAPGGASGNGGVGNGGGGAGVAGEAGVGGTGGKTNSSGGVAGGAGTGAASGGSSGKGGGCTLGGACTAVAEVSLGRAHACLRRGDGAVYCWGENERGQLGRGTAALGVLASPALVEGVVAERVSCGGDTSCASTPDGMVACWGDDSFGQLGREKEVLGNERGQPAIVLKLASASSVSVGASVACVIETSGSIRCWGDNRTAALGVGPALSRTPILSKLSAAPVARPDPVGIGQARSCARGKIAEVNCVGGNRFAETGTDSATELQYIGGLDPAEQVALGAFFACERTAGAGAVFCWGRGDEGQLGTGTASASESRTGGAPVPGLEGASSLAAGTAHACAVLPNQTVTCWGDCSQGACGNGKPIGSTPAVPSPTAVPNLGNVKTVFAGHQGTCALLADDTLKCWGAVAGAAPTSVPTTVALP